MNVGWLTMVTVSKWALTRGRSAWYWSHRSKSGDSLEPRVTVGCALQLGYGYKIGFNLLWFIVLVGYGSWFGCGFGCGFMFVAVDCVGWVLTCGGWTVVVEFLLVCGGWQLIHGGGRSGFWLLWVDSQWWWWRWVGRIWVMARGESETAGTDGTDRTEPRCTSSTGNQAADPRHRQGRPRNWLVWCGLRRWSFQPAGEPNRTDWYFYFLKFPLLPPTQPPLSKVGNWRSRIQFSPKSNPQFAQL